MRIPPGLSQGDFAEALRRFEAAVGRQWVFTSDEDLDLYGHTIEISFVERIRGMVAYAGIDPLIAQIGEDVERARAILTAETA